MSRYDYFKEMGLTDERYFQMMKSFGTDTFEERIQEAIDAWGIERVNAGYEIFDFDGTGLLEIEEIMDIDAFGGDDEAAVEQAIADDIKIIPVCELPENFDRRYLGWIDTPENRSAIEQYCKPEQMEL